MGILSLILEKKIHPNSKGKFQLFYGKPGEFNNLDKVNAKLNPMKLIDEQIYSGYLSLVEPTEDKKFGAYISLGTAR